MVLLHKPAQGRCFVIIDDRIPCFEENESDVPLFSRALDLSFSWVSLA